MLAAVTRWFLWIEDVGPEVVDLPFFFEFVDGRRQVLVQESMRTFPGRRATASQQHVPRCMQQACSSTHKDSLVIVLPWILQWWRLAIS
jgi:hypothetical protein